MTSLRGRVITPHADLPDAVIEIQGSRIVGVAPAQPGADEPLPRSDVVLLPGLVDLHCHGGGGASFSAAEEAEVADGAAHHLGQGTTVLIGSTVTDSPRRMVAAIAALADGVDTGALVGIHIEGPFLSTARCGAQDPAWIRPPDLGLLHELLDAGRGHVRIMTLAPELPGADAAIELLSERGVIAAVGHTEADAATVGRALRRARPGLVTHLFNGMPAIHHRDPGPVIGALTAAAAGAAHVELIADGVHLADEMVAAVFSLVGGSRVVLVTDAMAAAGLQDGDFQLGPSTVRVRDGIARLAHGESLAGGTSRLLDIVRRQIRAGLDPVEVVACASSRPAAVLGLQDEVGSLAAGCRADIVEADADLRPLRVMRAGTWVA